MLPCVERGLSTQVIIVLKLNGEELWSVYVFGLGVGFTSLSVVVVVVEMGGLHMGWGCCVVLSVALTPNMFSILVWYTNLGR